MGSRRKMVQQLLHRLCATGAVAVSLGARDMLVST